MQSVLIIGGTGFIGGHLAEQLYHQGYKVAALVRKNSATSLLRTLGIELRFGDLLQPDSLKEAFFGVDTIFCAVNAKPFVKSRQEYEDELYRLHIDGTRNLLAACQANSIRRLIYFSSVAAIGYIKELHSYNETSPENPIDAYGKAKLAAENILNHLSQQRKMEITILRPPGVFGERGLGALEKIIFFVEKRCVPIIGRGENRLSLTYVGNLVQQTILVAKNSNSIGKTYITSDERPYSLNELINTVCRVMNKQPLKMHIPICLVMFSVSILNLLGKVLFKREFINKENILAISSERVFDGSKIFRELGCKQKYDLAESIRRTIEWQRKAKNIL